MSELPRITVGRCRNPAVIEAFLVKDYFDGPVCYFPQRMIHAAAKWLAASDVVFFIVAESSGQPAGFAFSHMLGPKLWRSFLTKHPALLPYALYAMMRRRIPWLRRRTQTRFTHIRPEAAAEMVSELRLPKVGQPFRWSPRNSHTVCVDLLCVAKPFRGRNLANSLLQAILDEASRHDVRRAEAHINHSNYASVRAFQKAGWKVVQTSTDDLMASYLLEAPS